MASNRSQSSKTEETIDTNDIRSTGKTTSRGSMTSARGKRLRGKQTVKKTEIKEVQEIRTWRCPICEVERKHPSGQKLYELSWRHMNSCHPKEWEQRQEERTKLGYRGSGWTYGKHRNTGLPIMVEGLPEDQKGWTCIGCKKSFMFGEKNPIAGASLAATKHMAICEALKTKFPNIKTLTQHRTEARHRHPELFQRAQRPLRSEINTKLEGHQM